MKKLVCLIGCCLFVACLSMGCDKKKEEKDDSLPMQSETINDDKDEVSLTLENEDLFLIATPYGNLAYPKTWEEVVKFSNIEEDGYTVEIYAQAENQEFHVLDFVFEGSAGFLFGTMKYHGEDVEVRVVIYEVDESIPHNTQDMLYAMQEDINVVAEYFQEQYGFEYNVN